MANNKGQIVLGLDTPKTVSQINADIKKLQNQLKQVKAIGALDTDPTVKKINAQINALQSQLKTIEINTKIDTKNVNKTAQQTGRQIGQTIADGIKQSSSQVDSEAQKLLSNIAQVTAEAKQEWQSHMNRLSSGSDIAEENNDINSCESNIENLGLSWADKLTQAWERFSDQKFITGAMETLYNRLQKMPEEVYEIDKAMTNLYKVTDATSSKYKQFLDSTSDSARNLGMSISSLIDQTANWAKLGFSLDESEQLAKISSIYANVGEVDHDTAISDMMTAMKAFNIGASDSIAIVDKLYKLGNEYATSAADLGDGLSRSASAMAASGTDLNKTLAMLTGGTEITQNASEFGNFLEIGSMRIRGMKEELEALGEEVDETVDSISKVQTQILNRTGGKVNIFDDMGNFRDYYDIMEDISKVYNDLSASNKADLSEILFGKQRGNQGAALIQAFQSGQIQEALEATMNSEGSAMQEQERLLESLEAKTQQFEAAFQSLSNTVLESDLLKWFVDFGTGSVKAIDSIVSALGSLNTLSAIGGGFLGANGLG